MHPNNPTYPNSHAAAATDSQRWRLGIALGLVLLVGLLARVGLGILHGFAAPPEVKSDQEEYDAYAWNLARGQGYRGMSPDVSDRNHLTAYRPPGPSVLMAAVYLTAGHRYDAVRLVHCLLGVGSIWLVFRIGRRAFNDAVGFIGAAVYALFPLAVLQSTELLSEPLGVFLFLAFIDAAMIFANQPSLPRAALTGLILGLGLLTRANFVLMVPLAVIWLIWQFRDSRENLFRAAIIPAISIAALLPWAARNYQVFGEFVPLSTMGGSALLQGNNSIVVNEPQLFGYSVWDTQIPECREALQTAGNEVERDRRAKQVAIRWLTDNKDKWGFLLWHKFERSWTPFLTNNPSSAHRMLYLLSWGPVLLLLVAALVPTILLSLRHRHPMLLLHLALLHYVANSVIFFANIRYRAPVDPLCIILAASAVNWLVFAIGWKRVGNPYSTTPEKLWSAADGPAIPPSQS